MANKIEYPISLVIKAIDQATAPIKRITDAIKKGDGETYKKAFAKVQESFKGFKSAASAAQDQILGLGAKLLGLGAAAGFGFYHIIKGAVESGDKLSEVAQRVGLGVDAFASLSHAANLADIDQESFNGAMDQFNKRLGEAKAGGGSLLEFLKKVSPALAKQVKGAKSTESALSMMTDAMHKIQDPSKRAALSAAAFGKSGLQMGQFLGQGSDAIQKQQLEYMRLHGSSKQFADGASDLDNAMKKSEIAFMGLRDAAAGALFPALTKLAEGLANLLANKRTDIAAWAAKAAKAIGEWVDRGGLERLSEGVKNMAKAISDAVDKVGGFQNALMLIGAYMAGPAVLSIAQLIGSTVSLGRAIYGLAFAPVVAALGTFVSALGAGFSAMEAFNLVLLMNPIGLVIGGLVALGAIAVVLYNKWQPFRDLMDAIWGTLKEVVNSSMKFGIFGVVADAGKYWGQKMGLGADTARPSLGAAAAAPVMQSRQTNDAHVIVSLPNVPKGTRVQTEGNQSVDVNMSTGPSMVTP